MLPAGRRCVMGAVGGVQRLLKHLLVVDTPTACCGMGRMWFALSGLASHEPGTSRLAGWHLSPKRGYPQDPRRLACFLPPPLTRRGVVRVQPAGSVSPGPVSCCLVLGGPSIATQHTHTQGQHSIRVDPRSGGDGPGPVCLSTVLSNPCLPVSGPSSRTEPRRTETFSGLKHCV